MWIILHLAMEAAVSSVFNQCYYDLETVAEDKLYKVMCLYPDQPPDWQKGVDDVFMAVAGVTVPEFMELVVDYAEEDLMDCTIE